VFKVPFFMGLEELTMLLISTENFKKNAALAWPLALNAILVQSMVLIDLMMIAPLGEIPVNALGIAAAIIAFFIGTQFALANGTQMLIARAVGGENQSRLIDAIVIGGLINITFTLAIFLFIAVSGGSLLVLVVDDLRVRADVSAYIEVSMWMLLASSITQVIIAYFNGSGRTRIPLYGFVIEMPINIALSLVLIYGLWGFPELGIKGAAIGSLIAVLIRAAYLIICMQRDRIPNLLEGMRKLKRGNIKAHLTETMPIAANHVVLAGGMMMYQLLFAQLGVYAYAAIALVMPWIRLGSHFTNAWSQATVIHISQYRGRGETHLIPLFLQQTVRVTLIAAVLLCLAFALLNLILPWLYPAMDERTLVALSVIAPVYVLRPLNQAFNTFCGHTLRALGESVQVLKLHIIVQWLICLPILAVLIYIQAPLIYAFSVILLEEGLKTLSFRRQLKRKMSQLHGLEN